MLKDVFFLIFIYDISNIVLFGALLPTSEPNELIYLFGIILLCNINIKLPPCFLIVPYCISKVFLKLIWKLRKLIPCYHTIEFFRVLWLWELTKYPLPQLFFLIQYLLVIHRCDILLIYTMSDWINCISGLLTHPLHLIYEIACIDVI